MWISANKISSNRFRHQAIDCDPAEFIASPFLGLLQNSTSWISEPEVQHKIKGKPHFGQISYEIYDSANAKLLLPKFGGYRQPHRRDLLQPNWVVSMSESPGLAEIRLYLVFFESTSDIFCNSRHCPVYYGSNVNHSLFSARSGCPEATWVYVKCSIHLRTRAPLTLRVDSVRWLA